MNLYLLRHGLAVDLGAPGCSRDAERPLTPEGKRKLRKIAKAMEKLELSFDCVLSSPLVRARETAEIVARQFGLRRSLELTESLAPGGSDRELIRGLAGRKPAPENVLLVGHEPGLSRLVLWLVSGSPGFAVQMKKSGLCKLSVDSLKPGCCARLEWLLTPAQLLLIA